MAGGVTMRARRAGRYMAVLEAGGAPAPAGGEGIRITDVENALYVNSGLFDINAAYTVAGWVRATESEYTPLCFVQGDDEDRLDSFWRSLTNIQGEVWALDDEGTEVDGPISWDNSWRHVAFVRESAAEITAYVDGVDRFTIVADMTGSVSDFICLGNQSPANSNAAVGTDFAQWRVWTAALNAGQIAAEMASATPVRTSGLWADWRMAGADEAARLADSSGNGRDLQRAGAETETFTDGPL